jgi:FMN phosphatase YigB (HAD superfamily)
MGAATFGFRTAWINRAHLPAEYEPAPDATLAGLNELITMAP